MSTINALQRRVDAIAGQVSVPEQEEMPVLTDEQRARLTALELAELETIDAYIDRSAPSAGQLRTLTCYELYRLIEIYHKAGVPGYENEGDTVAASVPYGPKDRCYGCRCRLAPAPEHEGSKT